MSLSLLWAVRQSTPWRGVPEPVDEGLHRLSRQKKPRRRRGCRFSVGSRILGKLPTPAEYLEYANALNPMAPEVYRYLNFDQISDYISAAERAKIPAVNVSVAS